MCLKEEHLAQKLSETKNYQVVYILENVVIVMPYCQLNFV